MLYSSIYIFYFIFILFYIDYGLIRLIGIYSSYLVEPALKHNLIYGSSKDISDSVLFLISLCIVKSLLLSKLLLIFLNELISNWLINFVYDSKLFNVNDDCKLSGLFNEAIDILSYFLNFLN